MYAINEVTYFNMKSILKCVFGSEINMPVLSNIILTTLNVEVKMEPVFYSVKESSDTILFIWNNHHSYGQPYSRVSSIQNGYSTW